MATKNSTLVNKMDIFAKQLLDRACKSSVPPANGDMSGVPAHLSAEVPLADQVQVFTAVQRWVQIKQKVDPDDDAGDFISAARSALNGTAPGRRRGRKRAAPAEIVDDSIDDGGELDPVL